jgi:hypothetical protein
MLCAFPSEEFEDINPEADFIESKISKAVSLRHDPVAFIQVNEKTVNAPRFKKVRRGCVTIGGYLENSFRDPTHGLFHGRGCLNSLTTNVLEVFNANEQKNFWAT